LLKPDVPERNESELKALFQTMRQADAERAPTFSATLKQMPYRDRLGYLRAIAVAGVAVMLLIVAGVNALRHGAGDGPVPAKSAKAESAASVQAVVASTSQPKSGGGTPPLQPAGRRRYKGAKSVPSVPSISTWKSPTDALLKMPGDLLTDAPSIRSTKVLPSPTSE